MNACWRCEPTHNRDVRERGSCACSCHRHPTRKAPTVTTSDTPNLAAVPEPEHTPEATPPEPGDLTSIAGVQATVTQQLEAVTGELADCRAKRDALNTRIRDLVAAQENLARVQRSFTPKTRK